MIENQYFPPIAFFVLWSQCDELIVEQHENYQKKSYRNRCCIAGADGKFYLSVPLRKGKHDRQRVTDVEITYDEPWHQRHCRAIQSAYGKAPFFRFYDIEIKSIFDNPGKSLFVLNLSILKRLGDLLGMTNPLALSMEYVSDPQPPVIDFRNKIGIDQKWKNYFQLHPYGHVFADRLPFEENLSILDLLFCKGPESNDILMSSKIMSITSRKQ